MIPSRMKLLSSAVAAIAALTIAPATCAFAANPAASGMPSALLALKASGTTDRIIVRYRDNAGSRKSAAAATIAGRRGLMAKHLRITGVGAQVWALDRRVSESDAQALAETIAATDAVRWPVPSRSAKCASQCAMATATSDWRRVSKNCPHCLMPLLGCSRRPAALSAPFSSFCGYFSQRIFFAPDSFSGAAVEHALRQSKNTSQNNQAEILAVWRRLNLFPSLCYGNYFGY